MLKSEKGSHFALCSNRQRYVAGKEHWTRRSEHVFLAQLHQELAVQP